MSAVTVFVDAGVLDDDARHRRARRVRQQLARISAGAQREIGMRQGRTDRDHVGVGFGQHRAGEPVAIPAAHAGAKEHVRFVEQNAAGRMKRPITRAREIVRKLLDARLVRHGRTRIRRAGRRLGGIFAPRAVHLIKFFGLRVVRFEVVICDRPGGRGAVVVLQYAEIFFA
jgi:hypothetical protein